jgi:CBS domain-containing protein
MMITDDPLCKVTARDVMTCPVEVIPHTMSLRAAARLLVRAGISGAPVVDAEGRCVGVLSANDFVRWTEEGAVGAEEGQPLACPYQQKGRLLTGEEAAMCFLAEGSCPWQMALPTTGGRHATLCRLPNGVYSDWQQMIRSLPTSAVKRYMTTDVVTAEMEMPLPVLARTMLDARIHRIIVVDDGHRPTGIVTSMDILAAVARADSPPQCKGPDAPIASGRRTANVSTSRN